MANHKQALKRVRQRDKHRARNRLIAGRMRTALKQARTAIDTGEGDKPALVARAVSLVDRAVTKGVVKRSTASRTISRLMSAASRAS